jgi:putative SOS response-associated peptidase YedK
MCGRYASVTPASALRALVRAVDPVPTVAPNWNVAPGRQAMVVRRHPKTGARHLDLLTWGFLPHWAVDPQAERKPINARAETVATSPMFRAAFAHGRGLVPADAYYEWKPGAGGKQPYAFARRDEQPIMLAGLWDIWQSAGRETIRSFTIITTAANAAAQPVHDRMPVVLEPDDWPLWLGEAEGSAATLLHPPADSVLRGWPVSRRVNSPRQNDAGLLEPLSAHGTAGPREEEGRLL